MRSSDKKGAVRVLMMSNMYPSPRCPRYGIFVRNFQHAMENEGIIFPHIVVVTDSPVKSAPGKAWNYLKFYIKAVIRILQGKYDFVYVHYPLHIVLPLLLLLPMKKKIVLNFHGDDVLFNTRFKKLLAPYLRVVTKRAQQIVVPSIFFKQQVAEIFNVPGDRIYVYPSGGIDTRKFKRIATTEIGALKQQHHIKDELVLGFIANLVPGKGWTTYLQACAELAKQGIRFKAVMIGDGPDKSNILTDIAALGLQEQTILIPAMPQEQVIKYYSIFDLFLFPTYQESLGLVGLEAMACGTPVIASNLEGPATYIESGVNGILFEAANYQALTDAVLTYIAMPAAQKEGMISAAYETVQAYDTQRVAVALYQQLQQVYAAPGI